MRKMMLAAAVSAGLLAGCATTAPDGVTSDAAAVDPSSPLSAPGYMQMAASSDMFEIESSRMALQMSRNPQVRQFAQMMIDDHSRTTSEIMSVASQLRLPPPPQQMMPHHAQMLDRLRAAAPADFDRAYKAEQIMAHEEALTLHRNYAERGDAAPFREVAARAVPIIEAHFGHARSLPDYVAAPVASPPAYETAPPATEIRRRGERG